MNKNNKLYPSYQNPLLIKPSRPLPKEVAIIGSGTIGPDIGYFMKSSLQDIRLYLVDIAQKALENAEKRILSYAEKAQERKKMSDMMAKAMREDIIYTTDYSQIKDCDLIIEAATENIPIKKEILSDIEKIVREDTIITSNTSSIPADRIFNEMERPQRTGITHFFGPAWKNPLLEVVPWDKSDQEIIDYLFWLFAYSGKYPVITDNAICFMLDRIFVNWCNEAVHLLEYATVKQIEQSVGEYVFAGPFLVLNMVNGNPIIIETNTLMMEEGAHYKPALMLASVDRWLTPKPGEKVDVPDELKKSIKDRMLGSLFSQSLEIIDKGIGTKEDLNFGCQIALGFRKGPLDIMRDLGDEEIDRIINKYESERPGFPQPRNPLPFYQEFKRLILVDEIDGFKIITIRRPQAMNALNDEIISEILSVLREYSNDSSVRGFVITGYGRRAFSAGADIGKFTEMLGDRDASIQYSRDCAEIQLFLDQMDKPVIAAINGMALGGGFELAIRCHGMVAAEKSYFQLPEITIGILPGLGGCIVPYRKWPDGAELFNDMICLARPLKAQEAFDLGMVSKITDDGDLIQNAVEEVKNLEGKIPRIPDGKVAIPEIKLPEQPMAGKLQLSKEALSIIVKTIKAGADADNLNEALEIGYKGFGEIACIRDATEGVSAFLEKRIPEFNK